MTDNARHFRLNGLEYCPENELEFPARIYADVVDMTNNLIVDACVKAARQAGINDLYLLDKQFVLDALREKIERERGGSKTMNWRLTEKELPTKPGFYLVACEIEPGYYAIGEGEFFLAGTKAMIEPPPVPPCQRKENITDEEAIVALVKMVSHTEIVPENGFYDTKEFLYQVHPACWAELPELPNGWKNQNDYMEG